MRGRRWKSYCDSICATCNTIFYVQKAQRYCYEDKFELTQVPKKMIYKKDGKVNVIATGIIESDNHLSEEEGGVSWEKNLVKPIPYSNDKYTYLIKETCIDMKISYEKFIKSLNRIAEELETGVYKEKPKVKKRVPKKIDKKDRFGGTQTFKW